MTDSPEITPALPRYDIRGDHHDIDAELMPDGEYVRWDDLAAYFTPEDIAWLKRMEFTTLDRGEASAHQAWLQTFLARIAALLPPAPHEDG